MLSVFNLSQVFNPILSLTFAQTPSPGALYPPLKNTNQTKT
jgi:hypothetical protein